MSPQPRSRAGVAFDWAVLSGDVETMELLAAHPDVDIHAMNKFGCAAVQWASSAGQVASLQWLQAKGISLAHVNSNARRKTATPVALSPSRVALLTRHAHAHVSSARRGGRGVDPCSRRQVSTTVLSSRRRGRVTWTHLAGCWSHRTGRGSRRSSRCATRRAAVSPIWLARTGSSMWPRGLSGWRLTTPHRSGRSVDWPRGIEVLELPVREEGFLFCWPVLGRKKALFHQKSETRIMSGHPHVHKTPPTHHTTHKKERLSFVKCQSKVWAHPQILWHDMHMHMHMPNVLARLCNMHMHMLHCTCLHMPHARTSGT